MLTTDKFVFQPNNDEEYPYKDGYIDMPVEIFGQVRFTDREDERLAVSIPHCVDLEAIIEPLNDYLAFLSDCRLALEKFYYHENKDWIDKYFDGKLTDDWYETLEVDSGTIDIDEDGAFSARFSCGDNMSTDHLLMIEFSDREIDTMYFEG